MAGQERNSLEYVHIDHCVAGPDMNLDVSGSTQHSLYPGCKCIGICSPDTEPSCSCKITYDKNGRLQDVYLFPSSPPVFECNSNCSCVTTCINRITQQYSCLLSLDTFHTAKKGTGVCTKQFIPKGKFVGEYVGEVLSSSKAKDRLKELKPDESCYLVQYKEHMSNGSTLVSNIDAKHKGNLTRFINHSCSPNLVMIPVRSDSILPRLCLFACRDIAGEEEVCFSYFGKEGSAINTAAAGIELGTKQCLCESKQCVGYLPLVE